MWRTIALTTITTASASIVCSPLKILEVSTSSSCRRGSVAKSWRGVTRARESTIGSLPIVITPIAGMAPSERLIRLIREARLHLLLATIWTLLAIGVISWTLLRWKAVLPIWRRVGIHAFLVLAY